MLKLITVVIGKIQLRIREAASVSGETDENGTLISTKFHCRDERDLDTRVKHQEKSVARHKNEMTYHVHAHVNNPTHLNSSKLSLAVIRSGARSNATSSQL